MLLSVFKSLTRKTPIFMGVFVVLAIGGIAPNPILAPISGVSPSYAHGDRPQSFADLSQKLIPSVVNISTATVVDEQQSDNYPQFPPGSPFEEFLDEFKSEGNQRRSLALGTGFIIDESGIIVTNNHVIKGADKISVTLHNNKTFEAKLVGHDPKTDLAVLKIDPDGDSIKAVKFGDSDAMRVGDWAVAIGNPFGLGGTVTVGVISARGRDIGSGPYDDFIQTDAAINRGNSGGPLFNLDGDVIGINTAILSPSGGSDGVGFAISSNLAMQVVDQLAEHGKTRRGWLGVFIQDVTKDIALSLGLDNESGALVSSVHPEGPAYDGGLKPGDVIIKFDGKDIDSVRSLPRSVAETPIGKTVNVEVIRDGKRMTLPIILGELEEAEEAGLIDTGEPPQTDENIHSFAALGFSVVVLNDATRKKYEIPHDNKGNLPNGVVVTEVVKGSPAAKGGVKIGDVIRRVGQTQVMSVDDLVMGVNSSQDGKASILLLIRRDLREQFVAVPLQ